MDTNKKHYERKPQFQNYVSQEQIENARRIDLLSYLKTYEPQELVKCGANVYCTREHDSLKLSNGKWFWWSRGIGGVSALDYLIEVKGIAFTEAVRMLTGEHVKVPFFSLQKARVQAKEMYLPPHNFECKVVKPYLQNRGISDDVIEYFISQKMIAEDDKNKYAFFFGNDEKGRHRQCSVRATDGKLFKKEISGSDKHYSFQSNSRSGCTTLRVFECAIDLMSFATLMKDADKDFKNENMMSLSGVYMPNRVLSETKIPKALEKYLGERPTIDTIILHLDADKAGKAAAEGLIAVLKDKYNIRYVPPPSGKDFNDYLLRRQGREYNNNKEIEER